MSKYELHMDSIREHTSDIRVHRVTYGWYTNTYEWHTDDIRVHTSDIRMTYEYIRVTYEWNTLCHSYVLACHSYVARMSFVCHSYVLACHPFVTRMQYSHVICLSLFQKNVNITISSVSVDGIFYFYFKKDPYITLMSPDVILMSLVCPRMSSVFHSYVVLPWIPDDCLWQKHKAIERDTGKFQVG